jgi:signal transduction histidine kinase
MLYVPAPEGLRYLISGRTGPGSGGMVVLAAPLAGTGQAAGGYAAAAGAVLVLLAAAAFAVTRAILRPLREAAALAGNPGQGAGSRLQEVMARLGVPADGHHRRSGMTLARTCGRLQASRAAEAAARRSAAEMSEQLGEACLQLRKSVSIVRGFTQYCRTQDKPPPAGLDRMLQRVTEEIAGMETLVEGLQIAGSADRQPRGFTSEPHRSPGQDQ